MKNSKGFTLIELVVVIVILGILAATALPKFIDLSSSAGAAAASGVAASMASASSLNYQANKAGSSSIGLSGTNVCSLTTQWGQLVSGVTFTATGSAPASNNTYDLSGTGDCSTAGSGNSVSCTVTGVNGAASATVICL